MNYWQIVFFILGVLGVVAVILVYLLLMMHSLTEGHRWLGWLIFGLPAFIIAVSNG